MAQISIEADTSKANAFLDIFPRETAKAIPRATKKAGTSAMTLTKRLASKDMGLRSRAVAKRLKLRRVDAFTYEIRASKDRVPLIEFNAKGPKPSRGRGGGVSYRGRGGRKRVRNAFIATMPSGHEGVFVLSDGASRRGPAPNRSQLPIRQLHGPSVGRVVDRHRKAILSKGAFEFEREYDRLLNRIIGARDVSSGFRGRRRRGLA